MSSSRAKPSPPSPSSPRPNEVGPDLPLAPDRGRRSAQRYACRRGGGEGEGGETLGTLCLADPERLRRRSGARSEKFTLELKTAGGPPPGQLDPRPHGIWNLPPSRPERQTRRVRPLKAHCGSRGKKNRARRWPSRWQARTGRRQDTVDHEGAVVLTTRPRQLPAVRTTQAAGLAPGRPDQAGQGLRAPRPRLGRSAGAEVRRARPPPEGPRHADLALRTEALRGQGLPRTARNPLRGRKTRAPSG